MTIKPAYQGEALLLRWNESGRGRTVTLQLDEHVGEHHPFKGFKAGENGQRMQLVAVLVDDQEQAIENPDHARRSGPTKIAEKPADEARVQKENKPTLRSNLAAIMVKENQEFMAWLVDRYWTGKEKIGDYDGLLKRALKITSKKELDTDPVAAERFDQLTASFAYRNTVRQ